MQVTGPDGKSIFLPAGGWYDKTTLNNKITYGSYWTATGDGGTANAVGFAEQGETSAELCPACEFVQKDKGNENNKEPACRHSRASIPLITDKLLPLPAYSSNIRLEARCVLSGDIDEQEGIT